MIEMLTAGPRVVDLENLTSDDIILEVIAQALAHQNRYLGHTIRPYSVAEHSVLVARLVWQETQDPDLALWGLFHDAPETWLADIPTPVKALIGAHGMAQYLEAESRIMAQVAEKFGLRGSVIPDVVRDADKRLAVLERVMLFSRISSYHGSIEYPERFPGGFCVLPTAAWINLRIDMPANVAFLDFKLAFNYLCALRCGLEKVKP